MMRRVREFEREPSGMRRMDMRRAFGVSVLWVVTAICVGGSGRDCAAQANPQPAAKQSIWTLGIYTGPSPQTLTINGTNFLSSSTLTYNGAVPTAIFAESTHSLLSLGGVSDQAALGTYRAIATNPPPVGSGLNPLNSTAAGPAVSLSPTSLAFASQVVGTTSPAKAVNLSNSGASPLSISSLGVAGVNAGDFLQTNTCGSSVAAGASCTISVSFRPTTWGPRRSALSIVDNAGGSPQMVFLTGVGTGASLSPASLAFLTQPVGTSSPAQTVTLANAAGAPLHVWQVGFGRGGNPGDFTQTNNCVGTLAAGANCTISVTFTPTATGPRAATLLVSDDGGGSPQALALMGSPGPEVTIQPQGQSVTAPATATFSVTGSGPGTLSYQWYKNGAAISGATSASYTTPATTWGTNGAAFTVTATNSYGSTTSAPAILTVYPARTQNLAPVGPVLIGGQPQNQEVVEGTSATFTATAIGTEPITYQWNENGAPISGATSASYTTPATTSADNGESFTVTVTNSVNSLISAPATLTVVSSPVAPSIITQPFSVSVGQGNPASFYVVAAGSAPLSYQWSKNGTPIANATDASYTTPPTTSGDDKEQFTVTVTDSAGVMTSSAATLSITSTVYGLGGFAPVIPGNPNNLTGVQFRFEVVTNQSQGLKIVFGNHTLTTPGSTIYYNIETNVYSGTQAFANGGCTTWPLLGTYTEAEASLRNATPDYPFASRQQSAVGSSINTSDPVNWPIQTYLIDDLANTWKSDSISQISINGVGGLVTIQQADTLPNASSFQRCGLPMLYGTYRMWTITTQMSGYPTVVNQVVAPDADARYILAAAAMSFYSEFLNGPGAFAVQYWNFAYMSESNPVWTPVSTLMTNWNYDGSGQDFGVHVVSVSGQDLVEFSNVPGNSYLPGNLPFAIAAP